MKWVDMSRIIEQGISLGSHSSNLSSARQTRSEIKNINAITLDVFMARISPSSNNDADSMIVMVIFPPSLVAYLPFTPLKSPFWLLPHAFVDSRMLTYETHESHD